MTSSELRALVVQRLADRLRRLGLDESDLADDLDLVRSGVLDSLGFVDLITDLERTTGRTIDLEEALGKGGATRFGAVIDLFR
jgi:acyl carrier protein